MPQLTIVQESIKIHWRTYFHAFLTARRSGAFKSWMQETRKRVDLATAKR